MSISFDYSTKLIEVADGQTTLDVQALIDAIREEEAGQTGITYSKIADASGKEDLGNSVYVGITVELLDSWQVHFEENGDYIAKISGGNLVGGIAGDPVAYTSGVQVLLIQSAASTIVAVGGSSLTTEEHSQLMSLSNGLTSTQNTKLTDVHKAHMNKRARESSTGVITIYDDDTTTPYKQFDSNSDVSVITPK